MTETLPSSTVRRVVRGSCLVAILFVVADGLPSDPPSALADVAALLATLMGATVLSRVGANPVGWLLWLSGLLLAVTLGTGGLANYGDAHPGTVPFVAWLAWVSALTGSLPLFLVAGPLPLLFPTGRLPSPRWRIVVGLAVVVGCLQLLAAAVGVGGADTYPPGIVSPILVTGQAALLADVLFSVAQSLGGVLMAASIVAVAVRFRGASGVERQQLKWFAFAAFVTVAALVAAVALNAPAGSPSSAIDNVAWAATFAGVAFLPVAIGIAILRYHLYDIDRIISRTVSWAVVTALLAGIFVGAVVGLEAVLSGVTQGQTVAVAASTLVAAAAFAPVRGRIQGAVDRRFDRARHDAKREIDVFSGRLRDEVDLAVLELEVSRTALQTFRPASARVWLRNATDDPTQVAS